MSGAPVATPPPSWWRLFERVNALVPYNNNEGYSIGELADACMKLHGKGYDADQAESLFRLGGWDALAGATGEPYEYHRRR